jgi:hypothetical protein
MTINGLLQIARSRPMADLCHLLIDVIAITGGLIFSSRLARAHRRAARDEVRDHLLSRSRNTHRYDRGTAITTGAAMPDGLPRTPAPVLVQHEYFPAEGAASLISIGPTVRSRTRSS